MIIFAKKIKKFLRRVIGFLKSVFSRFSDVEVKKHIRFFKKQVRIQDSYDLRELRAARKMVVFVIPAENQVYGGMMSFFSLCEKSRDILGESAMTLIATCPCWWMWQIVTYAENKNFPNREKIYRFEQISRHAASVQELILHVPEIYADKFWGLCSRADLRFIKNVAKVQINILLQHIDLMPSLKDLSNLYSLSNKVTITTGNEKSATQEVSNKWNAPLKHVSVSLDISKYPKVPFQDKEKVILFSNDEHPDKYVVRRFIEEGLPDYRIMIIEKMTFDEYMSWISRARFTITFGEGFDAYFIQPYGVGSMGLSVYNERFFPSAEYLEMKSVYNSYIEMACNIKNDVLYWENHPSEYSAFVESAKDKFDAIYVNDNVSKNLRKFYANEYDFFPETLNRG